MKRDISLIPLNEQESIVVASDNSGGIGLKELDNVIAPYETVAYFNFRVALMECMAAGGNPLSIVVHNFCDDSSWEAIITGVTKGLKEIKKESIPITGSTESNFSLVQSAIGMVVLGKRLNSFGETNNAISNLKFAVIGSPLVGQEVLENEREVLPLSLFSELCQFQEVIIVPVGSRGILHELNVMIGEKVTDEYVLCDLDIKKSGGPATCVLIAFPPSIENLVQEKTLDLYHPLIFTHR